ncbi:MAG: bifunctional (p)ppGpp synthetase/guanosine-3',5'-bis(diphosphate) 3'-pyrophosphohydrolase, partial [Anaerolineales bacterium]|nr:bifunctional (p)ppGpp synthetase/guanosine-3',5'-bis(diphosphate) 3'-pyrophosphohydrolase [Anaerolineales bacterium]
MKTYIDPNGRVFFEQIATYLSLEDRKRVQAAFELARREHGDDRRKSGELFFTHPLTIAFYLSEYYVDAPALIAALLHDVAEDTSVSIAEIEAQFGAEVATIVDGLTKFDKVTAQAELGRVLTADEVKDATLRKLFAMMSSDVRVGIVKIFDRLHNMRTIKAMPPHKQREKAQETLNVYAPLANRLGMWLVKNELQNLSLEVLEPDHFEALSSYIARREKEQEEEFQAIAQKITSDLNQNGIQVADVLTVPIDIYELYLYQKARGLSLERDVEMPTRIVLLLKDKPECYLALGRIHALWRPVQGEFDDYIAAPRENLYRSLHTTVVYKGRQIKIRFRTLGMQIESQMGVLSRWLSNFTLSIWSSEVSTRMKEMLVTIGESIEQEGQDIGDGVRTVLDDVFTDQIVVYTRNGEMRELPVGATPVDFAYTIHTEVGNGCRGAKVNGDEVPLNYTLQDGDSVVILRRGSHPQRAWLDENLGYLKTSAAKTAVRRWFRRLPYEEAVSQGRALLVEELNMMGLGDYSHLLVAGWFGYTKAEEIYHELGRAEILPTAVAHKVLTDTWAQQPTRQTDQQTVTSHEGEWFIIENTGGRPTRMCGTCNPRPGDRIIGYIRTDGGVTAH